MALNSQVTWAGPAGGGVGDVGSTSLRKESNSVQVVAAKTAKQTPDHLAFVNPNPLPSSPDLIDLVKNAPHPAAAELFMTWLLSTAGQEAMNEISGRVSLRGDVTTQGDAWDEQKWAPAWAQPSLAPATINSYEQEMKEAFHVG